jgi:dihydrofolate reductase
MGRATWDSLPERSRPLPGRRNIVVTRNADAVFDGAERAASLEDALTLATLEAPERVWVIGGGQIYAQALEWADLLEVTLVDAPVVDGDAYAPQITDDWVGSQPDGEPVWLESRTGLRYAFTRYTRR